jgi:hypothetical protein
MAGATTTEWTRSDVETLARYALAKRRIPRLARLVRLCGMYELWYRSGLEMVSGLQGDLAGMEERLAVAESARARLETLAEQAAPTVSGWKVDLEAALAELERVRAEKAALEIRVAELESRPPAEPVQAAAVAAVPVVVPLQRRNPL